jgi:hypothetical protein
MEILEDSIARIIYPEYEEGKEKLLKMVREELMK